MNWAHPNKKNCPYCDPLSVHPLHLVDRLNKLVQYIFDPLDLFLYRRMPSLRVSMEKFISSGFIKSLLFAGILKENDILDDDEGIYNRTLVFVRETRKRNIPVRVIKFFGKSTNFFSITVNNKKEIFEGLPALASDQTTEIDSSDKYEFKKILKKNDLPYPVGKNFRNYLDAQQFVREIGFPVVVKPRSGSLSRHTTCNIKNEEELKKAIDVVKIISTEFIVERFVRGNVYRITVIDGDVAACCLREPPNIIGDGIHSIEELIKIKNNNPLRGESHQKNFSLHKIPITPEVLSFLKKQNFTINDVPPKGNKIYLHSKVILACGADIHDKSDEICEENRVLFKKVAQIFRTTLIGIDFICQDISKPYYIQECAIIEGNNLPYIDMHHYPVTGKPRNVAVSILDACLRKKLI